MDQLCTDQLSCSKKPVHANSRVHSPVLELLEVQELGGRAVGDLSTQATPRDGTGLVGLA